MCSSDEKTAQAPRMAGSHAALRSDRPHRGFPAAKAEAPTAEAVAIADVALFALLASIANTINHHNSFSSPTKLATPVSDTFFSLYYCC